MVPRVATALVAAAWLCELCAPRPRRRTQIHATATACRRARSCPSSSAHHCVARVAVLAFRPPVSGHRRHLVARACCHVRPQHGDVTDVMKRGVVHMSGVLSTPPRKKVASSVTVSPKRAVQTPDPFLNGLLNSTPAATTPSARRSSTSCSTASASSRTTAPASRASSASTPSAAARAPASARSSSPARACPVLHEEPCLLLHAGVLLTHSHMVNVSFMMKSAFAPPPAHLPSRPPRAHCVRRLRPRAPLRRLQPQVGTPSTPRPRSPPPSSSRIGREEPSRALRAAEHPTHAAPGSLRPRCCARRLIWMS